MTVGRLSVNVSGSEIFSCFFKLILISVTMAEALKNLLGDAVIKGKEKTAVETASLAGQDKVLGLYFSAHWCPPCRGFTPKLAEFYKKFIKSDKGGLLEIVFISSDRDEKSFTEYYNEMPWLALPFSERDRKVMYTFGFIWRLHYQPNLHNLLVFL